MWGVLISYAQTISYVKTPTVGKAMQMTTAYNVTATSAALALPKVWMRGNGMSFRNKENGCGKDMGWSEGEHNRECMNWW